MTAVKKIENEIKYFDFFKWYFLRNIKRRYVKKPLRTVFMLLAPVAAMIAAAPPMSMLFKDKAAHYPVFFFCGETIFLFLFYSIFRSVRVVKKNAVYIRAAYQPKHLFVVSSVAESSLPFLVSLVLLVPIMLITGAELTANVLFLPLLFVLTFMFSLGFSLITAAYGVIIKGLKSVCVIAAAVWLLLSPVFYPLSVIPIKYRFLFDLNPAVHYMNIMRTICCDGAVPSEKSLIVATIYSVLVLLLGISVFKSKEVKFYPYV